MNPLTQRIASLLPNQYHKHALEVDAHLRVLGAPLGTVYALGDCATIETNLVDHLLEFVERCDEDKDGKIDQKEFQKMMGVRPSSPSIFMSLSIVDVETYARSTFNASFLHRRSTSARSTMYSRSTSDQMRLSV